MPPPGLRSARNEAWTRLDQQLLGEAKADWQAARALYQAAKALGLTKSEALPECTLAADLPIPDRARATTYPTGPGCASLLAARTPALQYRNAYWLREKLLADPLTGLPEASREECRRLFYTGRAAELAEALGGLGGWRGAGLGGRGRTDRSVWPQSSGTGLGDGERTVRGHLHHHSEQSEFTVGIATPGRAAPVAAAEGALRGEQGRRRSATAPAQ